MKVLYRRWHPSSVDELRDTIVQAEDKNSTAKTLTDLVTQYGTRGWVDHAIDNVGPELFDWLEYVADMLEMTQKYALSRPMSSASPNTSTVSTNGAIHGVQAPYFVYSLPGGC